MKTTTALTITIVIMLTLFGLYTFFGLIPQPYRNYAVIATIATFIFSLVTQVSKVRVNVNVNKKERSVNNRIVDEINKKVDTSEDPELGMTLAKAMAFFAALHESHESEKDIDFYKEIMEEVKKAAEEDRLIPKKTLLTFMPEDAHEKFKERTIQEVDKVLEEAHKRKRNDRKIL